MKFDRSNAAIFGLTDYKFIETVYDLGKVRITTEKAVDGQYIAWPAALDTCCNVVKPPQEDEEPPPKPPCVKFFKELVDDTLIDVLKRYIRDMTNGYLNYAFAKDNFYFYRRNHDDNGTETYPGTAKYDTFLSSFQQLCMDTDSILYGYDFGGYAYTGGLLYVPKYNPPSPPGYPVEFTENYCEYKRATSDYSTAFWKAITYLNKAYFIDKSLHIGEIDENGNYRLVLDVPSEFKNLDFSKDMHYYPLIAVNWRGEACFSWCTKSDGNDSTIYIIIVDLFTGDYDTHKYSTRTIFDASSIRPIAVAYYDDWFYITRGIDISGDSWQGTFSIHRKGGSLRLCGSDQSYHINYRVLQNSDDRYSDMWYISDDYKIWRYRWT